ncbi:MAG: hypothetical protein UY51_C0006G0003 [Candidatus Jorgensenbacteria bacterium GW2011_GWB1_49_9]|uniref:Uncharacterized protein n=1 Tax=Candidatus Vogelbacteria bacterium GWA1_51_14 TaxID=1802435 RepID=A0A1G2QAC8_9BACT|nr:MAG: hypothetical protein UY51_C0006G0003 [Candidatus Jorgensenbacteria bacterium GW2011_GWB1_49_9]OHA57526.1 MAG: hypothetical protein A2114_00170 [Candidatus Vogelbacteria bacterium GWA1_51_14]
MFWFKKVLVAVIAILVLLTESCSIIEADHERARQRLEPIQQAREEAIRRQAEKLYTSIAIYQNGELIVSTDITYGSLQHIYCGTGHPFNGTLYQNAGGELEWWEYPSGQRVKLSYGRGTSLIEIDKPKTSPATEIE